MPQDGFNLGGEPDRRIGDSRVCVIVLLGAASSKPSPSSGESSELGSGAKKPGFSLVERIMCSGKPQDKILDARELPSGVDNRRIPSCAMRAWAPGSNRTDHLRNGQHRCADGTADNRFGPDL